MEHDLLAYPMRCHYCDESADVAIEKDNVTVGLCESHLRERMAELSDSTWLNELESKFDEASDG